MLTDDIRHACRRVRSRPGVMVASAVMLGLGIGLTTAAFLAVHDRRLPWLLLPAATGPLAVNLASTAVAL